MSTILKRTRNLSRAATALALVALITLASTRLRADTQTIGTCGGFNVNLPFTDVQSGSIFFCSIAEAYFSGLTNGTTPTTYSPSDPVTREQMAAFLTRTQDSSLRRASQRAALDQWWTPRFCAPTALTSVGSTPTAVRSNGQDVWVANLFGASVTRVSAKDGKVLETWSGMASPKALLIANGRVYVTGLTSPGKLYSIDPAQPAGDAEVVADVGGQPAGLAFDGENILVANSNPGSITIYNAFTGSQMTSSTGWSIPYGVLYDGSAFWVTDIGDNKIKNVTSSGQILQTVDVGIQPRSAIFDGTNIWVPNRVGDSITVVRASTGAVVATLTGNGMDGPVTAAFDGERILVTNLDGNSVSFWRATDLAPLGSFSTGANSNPVGACSDGVNFWVTLQSSGKLARF